MQIRKITFMLFAPFITTPRRSSTSSRGPWRALARLSIASSVALSAVVALSGLPAGAESLCPSPQLTPQRRPAPCPTGVRVVTSAPLPRPRVGPPTETQVATQATHRVSSASTKPKFVTDSGISLEAHAWSAATGTGLLVLVVIGATVMAVLSRKRSSSRPPVPPAETS